MKLLNDESKCLLGLLFKANKKLDAATLWRRSKLSYPVFAKTVFELSEQKLIYVTDFVIKISNEGIGLVANGYTNFSNSGWKDVPERFIRSHLEVDEMYIPSMKRLDKFTFKKIFDKLP